MNVSSLALVPALIGSLVAAPAVAHEVRAQVTPKGLEFVGSSLLDLFPDTDIEIPVWEQPIPFTCFEAKQRDTVLSIHELAAKVTIPEPGKLEVSLNLSAEANGYLTVEDAYLCQFAQSCSDRISINDATLTVQFALAQVDGKLDLELENIDVDLANSDLDIKVCDGIVGSVIGAVIDTLESFARLALRHFGDWAVDKWIKPLVSEWAAGLSTSYQTTYLERDIEAALSGLTIDSEGIGFGVDVDISSQKAAAECILDDPGEPEPAFGQPPAVSENAHLAVNLNLGLLNDAFYHAWRDGLTCVTGESLAGLGLDVHHLEHTLGNALPGLPADTHFEIHGSITKPPRIEGRLAEGAGVAVVVDGIAVQIIAHMPDGKTGTLDVGVDVIAAAEAQIDPANNAITVAPRDVMLKRLEIEDNLLAEQIGLDAAAIRTAIQNTVIPRALAEIGAMPVSAPIFGKDRFAVILTDLKSTQSHIAVEANLFVAPRGDESAPTTELVEAPGPMTNPHDAWFVVGGSDAEIPTDLLRYVVTINGETADPNHMRRFKVGEPGVSAAYEVNVQAIDLAGNIDRTGVVHQVFVDGVAPMLHVISDRSQQVEDTAVELSWQATDDQTAADGIKSRIEIFRLTDPKNIASDELVDSYEVSGSSATVSVDEPGTYRVAIVVSDEAGNETAGSVLLQMNGGCSAGTSKSSALWLLCLLGMAFVTRRRRRL